MKDQIHEIIMKELEDYPEEDRPLLYLQLRQKCFNIPYSNNDFKKLRKVRKRIIKNKMKQGGIYV